MPLRLLTGLAVGAGKAYSAYKEASEKNKNSAITNSTKTNNTKTNSTSVYTNPTFGSRTYDDEEPLTNNSGKVVGSISQQRADAKNGTAWIPGVGEIKVTIENGRVQETNLPVGTIVNTAGGQYKITGATTSGYTSTPYSGSYNFNSPNLTKPQTNQLTMQGMQQQSLPQSLPAFENPYDSYMKEIEDRYAALNNQISNANQAAVQQGVNRLQNQIPGLNQGYDDAARQAYIASMQSRRMLPQRLAIQGATGGATETANLGLETSYQNNLSDINVQRQNSLNEINNAITDIRNSGDLATAEQILQNNQSALSAYQNMMNNSVAYNQWLANYQANRDDTQWNQNYQIGRDNVNDLRYDNETANAMKQQEYNNILNRLGMGLISPNDAVALGVSPQDVQSFVDRIIAAQNADLANTLSITNKRNSGGSGGSEEQTNLVLATADKYLGQGNRQKAIEALSAIYTNTQIKQYLESKGYRTDDIDWGIEEVNNLPIGNRVPDRLPISPLSIENIVTFLKSQGLSNEEIAERLNRN